MKINSASIDITNKCNFRCRHWYNHSGDHNRIEVELSDQEVINIVSDLCTLHPHTICLCGGETMLRKSLGFDCIKQIKLNTNCETLVNIVSNDYFINSEVTKALKISSIDLVQISLDGATSETHDWLRNNDKSFKHAIQAIEITR